MSLKIINATIANADRTYVADVYCDKGAIVAIGAAASSAEAEQTIDALGCYLMPGGIDPHTHMQLPFMGTVAADDFFTGTRAALAGGTTMHIDFVIPNPQQSLLEAFDTWNDWAQKACCDYSFHVAVTWWSDQVAKEMEVLATERGVNSFKHFMAYKNAIMADDEVIYHSFSKARDLGALVTVHAENGELVFQNQKALLARGITGPEAHPVSRSAEVEGEAANRICVLADAVGVPLYIVHTSASQAIDAIARARRSGQCVFGEALTCHLVVDDSVYRNKSWEYAAGHVMSPPFRPREHQQAMWNAINSGDLVNTGTDHCAFTLEQKAMGRDDFTKIPNGTAGVQDRLHILWHYGVNQGRIGINDFVALTSTNTAKIFNIYPQKGVIQVGSDADMILWDPRATRTISAQEHMHNMDFSVYEGVTVKGVNRTTIARGKVVYDQGEAKVQRGAGRYIHKPTYAPYYDAVLKRNRLRRPAAVER